MPCETIRLPDGNVAIACGIRRPKPKLCKCGSRLPADLLCDWKTPTDAKPEKTCDAKGCARCMSHPAPGKDLCPYHTAEWERRQAARAQAQENRPDVR
jgi:hypothetical protein